MWHRFPAVSHNKLLALVVCHQSSPYLFVLSEPYARPTTILRNEFHASSLQCDHNGSSSVRRYWNLPITFRSLNGWEREARRMGNIRLREAYEMARRPNLCW